MLIIVLAVALAPHVDERPIQPGAHGCISLVIASVDKASSVLFYDCNIIILPLCGSVGGISCVYKMGVSAYNIVSAGDLLPWY